MVSVGGSRPGHGARLHGPSSGVGAVYAWKGNSKAGEGRMEILESRAASTSRVDLVFAAPMKAHNRVDFTLTPRGGRAPTSSGP